MVQLSSTRTQPCQHLNFTEIKHTSVVSVAPQPVVAQADDDKGMLQKHASSSVFDPQCKREWFPVHRVPFLGSYRNMVVSTWCLWMAGCRTADWNTLVRDSRSQGFSVLLGTKM